jgi:hypothetical protein
VALRRRTGLIAAAAALVVLVLGGCGFGGGGGTDADRPATTAAAGTRVAPPGAPYAFTAPGGFARTTLHPDQMKAGSHIDALTFFDRPTVDGLTTLGVMAFDAGEPVRDDPITLGSRFWREIGPGGSDPPPITAGALGALPAFAITYNGAAGQAPTRTTYLGAAVGNWVVVATCTGAGAGAIAGLDSACHGLTSTVELAPAPRAALTSAPVTAEAGAPYTFTAPGGFTTYDPAIVRAQLGGVPASLVLRSWENRVLVFSSDAGRPLTSIAPEAFCGVVQKILPGVSTTPVTDAGTIGGARGVRCDARAFTDTAGRTIPGLEVDAHGAVHGTRLLVVLCYSTPAQRREAQAGCQSVLGSLAFR